MRNLNADRAVIRAKAWAMPGRREPGRMPGSSHPQDAASMHNLNADTVQSAQRSKHVRTHGAGHDARLHSDIACFIMPVD